MRVFARVAWRVAAAVAFTATAALAVTLTRGAPMHAALTSARNASRNIAAVAREPECRMPGLRIWVGGGDGVTPRNGGLAVEFTNTSGAACALSGYPQVAAYQANGAQVGNAASRDTSGSVRRIVLNPGATAHAVVAENVSAFPDGHCRPVSAAGLRVVSPGQSAARHVRHAVVACSAAGPQEPVFLHVRAVQAGIG
jgi:hypothetical protein